MDDDITSTIILSKFCIAQIIGDNLNRLVTNGMAAQLYFDRDIKPVMEQDFEYLSNADVEPEFIEYFIKNYRMASLY